VNAGSEHHTLAGAYALDALDDIERAAFDRHLRVCASCSVEVLELRETAAYLAADVAVAPPPALRDNVLAAIARTRQDRSSSGGRAGPAALARWRRSTAVAVAVGIISVGGGAAIWSVSQDQVHKAQAQAAAERNRIADVLSAPDAALRTKDLTGGGRVTVVVAPSRDAAVAVMSGLPAPGPTQAYELWLIGDGPAKPMGLVAAGQAAGEVRDTRLVQPLDGAAQFGLSREPKNGSPQPTQVLATVILR
jgi:anti-sigma-K factor RskA